MQWWQVLFQFVTVMLEFYLMQVLRILLFAYQPSRMLYPLSVVTPLSEELETDVFFPSCPVLVEGKELPADLVLLDIIVLM